MADHNFAPVHNALFESGLAAQLKPGAFATLVCLLYHADRTTHTCFPSIDRIAAETGQHRRTVRRQIELLENVGLLTVRRHCGELNQYEINSVRDAIDGGNFDPTQDKKCGGTQDKKCPTPGQKVGGYPGQKVPSNKNHRTRTNNKNQLKGDLGSQVDEIVSHYRGYHPRSRPGAKERKLIGQRLKDGYSVGDLKRAIDGCHRSAYHCGDNESGRRYQTLELIVRNSSKVDSFIEHGTVNPGDPAPIEWVRDHFDALTLGPDNVMVMATGWHQNDDGVPVRDKGVAHG